MAGIERKRSGAEIHQKDRRAQRQHAGLRDRVSADDCSDGSYIDDRIDRRKPGRQLGSAIPDLILRDSPEEGRSEDEDIRGIQRL